MDFLNTPEKRERRLVHLPMGRFGEAIEVAKGALFRESFLPSHPIFASSSTALDPVLIQLYVRPSCKRR